jgi:hypothetical protein
MNHNLFIEFPGIWLNILKCVEHRKPQYLAFKIFICHPILHPWDPAAQDGSNPPNTTTTTHLHHLKA